MFLSVYRIGVDSGVAESQSHPGRTEGDDDDQFRSRQQQHLSSCSHRVGFLKAERIVGDLEILQMILISLASETR